MHSFAIEHHLRLTGQLPKEDAVRRPVLSFADELEEESSPVAFSLAESTKKRCEMAIVGMKGAASLLIS